MTLVLLKTRTAEVNESVVALLEEWLELARAGDLVAVALAGIEADGTSRTTASQSECFPAMLGAVTILQHRMAVFHGAD